jgi:8-oxo-dGTP diphosphatase
MDKGIIVHTVIRNDNNEILIIRRSRNNDVLPEFWDVPGGTLEDGEDPAYGAVREVLEETGLKIEKPDLFFCRSNVDLKKNKQFITLVFLSKHSNGEISLNPNEHDDFVWIKLSEAKDYRLVEYLKYCFDLVASKKHSGLSL